jgi:hypothetical protein
MCVSTRMKMKLKVKKTITINTAAQYRCKNRLFVCDGANDCGHVLLFFDD